MKTVRVKTYRSAGQGATGPPTDEDREIRRPHAAEIETSVKAMRTTSKRAKKAFIYKAF